IAPEPELSTLVTAVVAFTIGFHPAMVPSSVAKRKTARMPGASVKSTVGLNTWPVGADGGIPPAAGGTVTTIGLPTGKGLPAPLYTVTTPVPLSETQNGPPMGLNEIPQGLTRFGSRWFACPTKSETRLRSK